MSQRNFLSGEQLPLSSWFSSGQTSKENAPSRSSKRKRNSKADNQDQGEAGEVGVKLVHASSNAAPMLTERRRVRQRENSQASRRSVTTRQQPTKRVVASRRDRATPATLAAQASLPTPETTKRPAKMPSWPNVQLSMPQTPRSQGRSLHLSSSLSDVTTPVSPVKHGFHTPTKARQPHSTPQSQRMVPCSQHSEDNSQSESGVAPSSQLHEEENPFVGNPMHSPSSRDFELPTLSSPITESNRSVSVPQRDLAFKIPPLPLHTTPDQPINTIQNVPMVDISPEKSIVPSSQSQYLPLGPYSASGSSSLPFASPLLGRKDTGFVPTSQSQEEELTVVKRLDWGFDFPSASSVSGRPVGRTQKESEDTLPASLHPSPKRNAAKEAADTPKGKTQSLALPELGSPGAAEFTFDSSQTEPDEWPGMEITAGPNASKQPESIMRDVPEPSRQSGDNFTQRRTHVIEDDSAAEDSDDDLAASGYRYRKAPRLESPSPKVPGDASELHSTSITPRFSSNLRISRKKLRKAPDVLDRLSDLNSNGGLSASDTFPLTQSLLSSSYVDFNGSLPSAVGDFLQMVGSDGSSLEEPSPSKTQD
ncbi:hypothetical protein EVG20_g1041 [Dentipellis fragilis]|uniref:Uncharacterized protein n=1 Tax=Dentipellis fragilis TaxID=205917 RepID=A0A4Y9ZEV8_9AGAM|nr:hypothetical protein EVG20_g1041 [Dentipellis fragilis]